ncbi:MAG: hypothetical protein M3R00_03340 [Pseudomonadota bacterium]|nr:hypothetical protein [Pseudomonadota bacterium]
MKHFLISIVSALSILFINSTYASTVTIVNQSSCYCGSIMYSGNPECTIKKDKATPIQVMENDDTPYGTPIAVGARRLAPIIPGNLVTVRRNGLNTTRKHVTANKTFYIVTRTIMGVDVADFEERPRC